MKASTGYVEILEVLAWALDKLSRPTLRNWIEDYGGYGHRCSASRAIRQLQQGELLRSTRSGKELKFSITDKGWARLQENDPERAWQRPWDGNWRAITFDVPEKRRKDRELLWRALRARKLGFLQRSIWVWPHDLRSIIKDLIQVEGLPECFFGFTTREVWLCNDAEIVAGSWDWDEIHRRQQTYLRNAAANIRALETAEGLGKLAEVARVERGAYSFAFSLDPLLPQRLLPASYLGHAVHERHDVFRRTLARRLAIKSSTEMPE